MLGREYIFMRPSLGKTPSKSAVRDSESAGPFSEAVRFAVVCQHSRFAGVLRLFQFRCPAAVAFFVVAIAIKSVNRSLRKRLWSHVLKEVDKRIKPSIANRDALSTIEMVIGAVGLVASSLHFLPRRVLGRFAHIASIRAVAPARLGRTLAEFAASHCSCISALAEALPAGITRLGSPRKLNYSEFAVNAPRFIFSVRRQLDRITRRHDSTLLKVGL